MRVSSRGRGLRASTTPGTARQGGRLRAPSRPRPRHQLSFACFAARPPLQLRLCCPFGVAGRRPAHRPVRHTTAPAQLDRAARAEALGDGSDSSGIRLPRLHRADRRGALVCSGGPTATALIRAHRRHCGCRLRACARRLPQLSSAPPPSPPRSPRQGCLLFAAFRYRHVVLFLSSPIPFPPPPSPPILVPLSPLSNEPPCHSGPADASECVQQVHVIERFLCGPVQRVA